MKGVSSQVELDISSAYEARSVSMHNKSNDIQEDIYHKEYVFRLISGSRAINIILDVVSISNITRESEFLCEVVIITTENDIGDDADAVIELQEENIYDAAQFLLMLARADPSSVISSYHSDFNTCLSYAYLSSKWIAGRYVAHFKAYIHEKLRRLVDPSNQQLYVMFIDEGGIIKKEKLMQRQCTCKGSIETKYDINGTEQTFQYDKVLQSWRFKKLSDIYTFERKSSPSKPLYECEGMWKSNRFSRQPTLPDYTQSLHCKFEVDVLPDDQLLKFAAIAKLMLGHMEYGVDIMSSEADLINIMKRCPQLRNKVVYEELFDHDDMAAFSGAHEVNQQDMNDLAFNSTILPTN